MEAEAEKYFLPVHQMMVERLGPNYQSDFEKLVARAGLEGYGFTLRPDAARRAVIR